ncbi:MAG: SbcC/MukB-like Walker B domain-containing protein, partial [Terrimesophilobacter sp.]
VTMAGQQKKSARRYEKNDRFSIADRSRWILGADNGAKIDTLVEQRRDTERRRVAAGDKLDAAQSARDANTRRRTVLESVLRHDWVDLDRAVAVELVEMRLRQLTLLTTGNSKLQDALTREQTARDKCEKAASADREAALQSGLLDKLLADLDAELARLTEQAPSEELRDADSALLEAMYRAVQRKLDRQSVGDTGRKVFQSLSEKSLKAMSVQSRSRSMFEEGAHEFRTRWPVAAADLTASIEDRAGYRELRATIEARGLPEHEQRFLKLLREKSRELIGHLLSDIRDAPKLVKDRIEPVNASLGRSEFDRDRFLRIKVKEHRTPEVNQFMADLRTVVDGSWNDDDLAAAEARFAVLEGVMRRLASSDYADVGWRQRCLDTREHVTFQAQEVDRAGRVTSVHDSSAGLSGGQRQKLVIFCLAAALRYQLAPDEEAMPTFATIILDEAFDKADSAYTRMAMDVFVAFGFHMILATPQKLLSTIEPYVDAVTSITNETHRKSRIANVVFGTADSVDTPTDEV